MEASSGLSGCKRARTDTEEEEEEEEELLHGK